jgi:hypothetical protein
VAADLAAVDRELVDEVAAAAELDRSELVLCASHTHSGPAGVVARLHPADDDRSDPALREAFVAACRKAIGEASERIEPVDLLFGSCETSGLAANRNNPAGPFDPRVSILATRGSDGEIQALLAHFACHPTILGAENRLVSADFPGALRRSLSATTHDTRRKLVTLFVNGAAGDVSTRFTRHSQDIGEVERVGAALATAATEAVATAHRIDGQICYDLERVVLSPRNLNERGVTGSRDDVAAASAAERRKLETRAQGATLLARLAESGPRTIRTEVLLESWSLGDIAFVAVPGELFASLGERIAAMSPSPTLVLGYANGYVGYLADEAAYEAGTYEALASPFAIGSGERIAKAVRQLLDRLRTNGMTGTVHG